MKKLLLVFLVAALTTGAFAQEKNGWVGMSVGMAIPGGDMDEADSGISFDIVNFGYSFWDVGAVKIGGALRWTGSAGTVDGNDDVTWGVGGFYVGPMVTFELGEKWMLDLKVLGGNTAVVVDDNGTEYDDSAFGINAGANLRFNFAKKWGLMLSLDDQMASIDDTKVRCFTSNVGIGFRF